MAAEKAAHEARRATTWSIVATFLNVLSLAAVGFALGLTVQSNRIARDTARRQLRAYISVVSSGYYGILNDGHPPQYSIDYVNNGATPAYAYRGYTEAFFGPVDTIPPPVSDEKIQSLTPDIMGPGAHKGAYKKPITVSPRDRAGFLDETLALFVRGRTEFMDSFGDRYRMDLAFRSASPKQPVVMKLIYTTETKLPRDG